MLPTTVDRRSSIKQVKKSQEITLGMSFFRWLTVVLLSVDTWRLSVVNWETRESTSIIFRVILGNNTRLTKAGVDQNVTSNFYFAAIRRSRK
jgi:hypothetical protein